MSQGEVIEQGTHHELMALQNEYYNLVTAQVSSAESADLDTKSPLKSTAEFDDERRKSVNEIAETDV